METTLFKVKNIDRKPTEESDLPFLFCTDDEIRKQYSHVRSWGKWMMYFPKTQLDEKWAEACRLYREKKLSGIANMKVSTAYDNPRASDEKTGVIIFYCGPPDDETNLMEYGRNLLECITYKPVRCGYYKSYMYYKSDAQTDGGTRATGQKKNWRYRLPVEDTFVDNSTSDVGNKTSESIKAVNPASLNIESKPSKVTDRPEAAAAAGPSKASTSSAGGGRRSKKAKLEEKAAD